MQAEGKWRIERMYFLYLHTSKSPYKIWGTDNLLRCWQKRSYLFPLSVYKNVSKYSVILSFSGIQKAFDFFQDQESLISTQYNVAQKKERMDSRNSGSMK